MKVSIGSLKIFISLTLILFGLLSESNAIDASVKEKVNDMIHMFQEDPDMGCKDIVVKMSKTQMTIIKKCTKEMKFTSPADQKERAACIIKCVLSSVGILKSDGKFNEYLINMLGKIEAPPKLREIKEKALEMFKKCREEHEPLFDNEDRTCKTYGPMIKCMMEITKFCN